MDVLFIQCSTIKELHQCAKWLADTKRSQRSQLIEELKAAGEDVDEIKAITAKHAEYNIFGLGELVDDPRIGLMATYCGDATPLYDFVVQLSAKISLRLMQDFIKVAGFSPVVLDEYVSETPNGLTWLNLKYVEYIRNIKPESESVRHPQHAKASVSLVEEVD